MSSTLYRKYRPQSFSDVIGQQYIVKTLTNAIKNGRLGHAYLFTGPRGTGKTTLARIFAKALNCPDNKDGEPCLKCASCQNIQAGKSMDIIEIDAASNTGVDNIRELRETAKLPPTGGKYKVYIIDEVHMLSAGAFNALLKTLEEPPAHVIFVLATTEIHKIPETILSRCQRFDFSRISISHIIEKLNLIAQGEKVKIESGALEMIAVSAEGGMRDAESLLSQILSLEDKHITTKEVEGILGTTDRRLIEQFSSLAIEKDLVGVIRTINRISEEGHNLFVFNQMLVNYFRQLLMASIDNSLLDLFDFELTEENRKNIADQASRSTTADILKMIRELTAIQPEIKSSFIPQLPIEMAVVRALGDGPEKISDVSAGQKAMPTPSPIPTAKERTVDTAPSEAGPAVLKIEPTKKKAEPLSKKASENAPRDGSGESEKETAEKGAPMSLSGIKSKWNEILKGVIPHNHSLNALLSNCEAVEIKESTVIIAAPYEFYKDRINEPKCRLTIEGIIGKILGVSVKIRAVTEEEAGVKIARKTTVENHPSGAGSAPGAKNQSNAEKPKENGNLLTDAMSILGGKIVD